MEIQDKELINKLNPERKFKDSYIQSLINKKRQDNIRNNKDINDDIENIDVSIEYANKDLANRYDIKWIQKQLRDLK